MEKDTVICGVDSVTAVHSYCGRLKTDAVSVNSNIFDTSKLAAFFRVARRVLCLCLLVFVTLYVINYRFIFQI